MSTLKEVNETRITLRNHEAIVENINNGIAMNRRTVVPSDLALSMLGILEDEAVVSHLLKEKNFNEIFEGFFSIQNINGESMIEEMNAIVDMAYHYINESEEDQDTVHQFFSTLVSRFDPTFFSEEETVDVIRRLLSKIRSFDDPTAIRELFFYVLDEVNLLGDLKGVYAGRILSQLFKRAKSSLDKELIHSLFEVTAKAAEREWILEVLEANIPKEVTCTTPLLPKNCFIYQEMLDGTQIVGIEVEAQRFDVQYHRKQFEAVGHPEMLYLFSIRGKKVLNCRLVCVKDQVLTPETQLYKYPFSNVHKDTSTCWPSLKNFEVKSVAHAGTLPFAFMNSSNNDHLFTGVNLGEIYMNLQGKDFDSDSLVPLNMTFNYWLNVAKGKLQ